MTKGKNHNRSNLPKSVSSTFRRALAFIRPHDVPPILKVKQIPRREVKVEPEAKVEPEVQLEPEVQEVEREASLEELEDIDEPPMTPAKDSGSELDDDEVLEELSQHHGQGLSSIGEELELESDRRYVFAHFMVGNTYPYTIKEWRDDIMLAASQNIDGFVLNVGREDWQIQRCIDCFSAAEKMPDIVRFKLFFSFDMSSIPGNSSSDVDLLRKYIEPHAQSERMFRHPRTGGIVVSTFSGENSTFGQSNMENGWTYAKAILNKFAPIHFVPSFFVNPVRYHDFQFSDGAFNWNGGWPLGLHPDMPRKELQNTLLDSDQAYLDHLRCDQMFMAAVSPWFFTHYGPDTWNKNWIYRSDDWLFIRRWEQLIEMRHRIEIAQIISWNDYGESHYIGPIKGAQPNSQAWVDGYSHDGWLQLNRYFAVAFQTGNYPTISKDQVFLWARPHPKDATSSDKVPRPDNWDLAEDVAWMVVLATAPATIDTFTHDTEKRTFQIEAGMSKLSFPLTVDCGMRAVMSRNNTVVAECNPIGYRFESRPGVYNFNAIVAMSR